MTARRIVCIKSFRRRLTSATHVKASQRRAGRSQNDFICAAKIDRLFIDDAKSK
jgi:hypothetical protein